MFSCPPCAAQEYFILSQMTTIAVEPRLHDPMRVWGDVEGSKRYSYGRSTPNHDSLNHVMLKMEQQLESIQVKARKKMNHPIVVSAK